ncbi:hypothetical protein ES288_D04G179200v1 [Gossypium darwinii]|uniref:Cell wall hydroxyproline-rich glycoprotein n=1 Tax=Gossypium darwinii TaxID=34276 RepID=A0A5D2D0G4_GOSDA|nr:hypothetical protein ES288_D04G179200v1 [Gossypium darwinii]
MFLLVSVFVASCTCDEHYVSSHGGLTDKEVSYIKQRQLLYYRDDFAWEKAILSDPFNLTADWVGSCVCDYTGIRTVACIDLNHGDIVGCLPEELGLLTDLALFHINSNPFCGTVPHKFIKLKLMLELDLSNNWFTGNFLEVILKLPLLKFLDLRFNEFEGTIPKELFDKDLDVIFINHNRFRFNLPDNFGNSHVSVIILANNKFHGCMPASLGNTTGLEEIILMNNGFRSCLPEQFGWLKILTVF